MTSSQTIGGSTTDIRGSVRWMAIELIAVGLNSGPSFHSKESDVWAYGMVLYVRLRYLQCRI